MCFILFQVNWNMKNKRRNFPPDKCNKLQTQMIASVNQLRDFIFH